MTNKERIEAILEEYGLSNGAHSTVGLAARLEQAITAAVEEKDARIGELEASLQAASFQLRSAIARERTAVAEEREACAELARKVRLNTTREWVRQTSEDIEALIRARSTASSGGTK